MNALPTRKPNRLDSYDYSRNGAYFITICTRDKKCILSKIVGATIGRPPIIVLSEIGIAVKSTVEDISKYYPNVILDHYVIMPNHVHLLLSIQVPCGRPMVAPTISTVVQQMKGYATKKIGKNIWQRSFHDHVIRGQRDYEMIWQYIDTNPVRWEQDCFYVED